MSRIICRLSIIGCPGRCLPRIIHQYGIKEEASVTGDRMAPMATLDEAEKFSNMIMGGK